MEKICYLFMGGGIILLLLFLAPLFQNGIVNIGTVTGVILAALLFFYGVFWRKVHLFLHGLSQHTGGKILLIIIGVVTAAVVCVALIETVWMVRAAENRPTEHGVPAIVLGCKVKGSKPSRVLTERLEAAYDYLVSEPAAIAILSGGKGEDEEISEAGCMYEYLTARGIEENRLILEDASTNTRENLAFSKEILSKRNLGMEVTIITSGFHEYRANDMAEKLGLKSYSAPAHTGILYFPTYYVRELYGILYYKLVNGMEN